MRRKIILETGESYAVNVSSRIKYLIIREATGNVLFGNENNQFIELSRSDKAVIDIYQGQRVLFINNNETQIAVDFQFSHIPLSIEEQTTSVNGAITVDEILKPIAVSEIIKPVIVDEIRKPIKVTTDVLSYNYSLQNLKGGASWTLSPTGIRTLRITSIQVIADIDNIGEILVAGSIRLPAGAVWSVDTVSGIDGMGFIGAGTDKFVLFFTYEQRADKSKSNSDEPLWTVMYDN